MGDGVLEAYHERLPGQRPRLAAYLASEARKQLPLNNNGKVWGEGKETDLGIPVSTDAANASHLIILTLLCFLHTQQLGKITSGGKNCLLPTCCL